MNLSCPACGADDDHLVGIERRRVGSDTFVITRCEACESVFQRLTTISCPRCASSQVHFDRPFEGWAPDEPEAPSRTNDYDFTYVDRHPMSCSRCHHHWLLNGLWRPMPTQSGHIVK